MGGRLGDSRFQMWIRPRGPLLARMPSTQGMPLNPRIAAPLAAPTPHHGGPPTRPGGFHESSYELKSGLEITESSWPDEEPTTQPGPPPER